LIEDAIGSRRLAEQSQPRKVCSFNAGRVCGVRMPAADKTWQNKANQKNPVVSVQSILSGAISSG
jgi:hypothetical protein